MAPKRKNALRCKMSIQPKMWDEQKMRAAVEGVRSKTFTLGKASKFFGIPKSTLSDKVNDKYPVEKRIKTILTPEEERKLALWLITLVKKGCKHPKQQLLQQVQKILNTEGRKTVFTNNLPGNKWYYAFLRRQGIVSLRQAQEIENRPDSSSTQNELTINQTELLTFSLASGEPETSTQAVSSKERIKAAVEAVKTKAFTLGKAAKIFGIPKSTLSDKVHERYPLEKKVKTILTPEEEQKLAQWLITIARKGCKFPKQQLLQQVQRILNNEGRETIFPNNLPGNRWYYAFLKRQGILPLCKKDALRNQPELLAEEICPKTQPAHSDQQNHLDGLLDIIQLIAPDKLTDYRHKLSQGKQCEEPEFVRFCSLYKRLSGIPESKGENLTEHQGEKRLQTVLQEQFSETLVKKREYEFENGSKKTD